MNSSQFLSLFVFVNRPTKPYEKLKCKLKGHICIVDTALV
jgi:hypothetical protein